MGASGHIQATNDQIAADNNGHKRFGIIPAHRAYSARRAGRLHQPALPDTEEVERLVRPRPGRPSVRNQGRPHRTDEPAGSARDRCGSAGANQALDHGLVLRGHLQVRMGLGDVQLDVLHQLILGLVWNWPGQSMPLSAQRRE
jgi:hypothetical protein